MKRVEAILAAFLALSLTGCALRAKQPVAKATIPPPVVPPPPPPPPKPLSTPQTDVQLPAYQPLSPEAIASTFPPEEPPPSPPAPKAPPRTRPQGNTTPRPVEVMPQGPPVPQTVEPERPKIQEALSPTEIKRLQDEADSTKREVKQRIDSIQVHRLNRQQGILVKRIRTFVDQSDDAQRRGDMRQAAELAQRALVLAKELQP
jgi:hypothetical protein